MPKHIHLEVNPSTATPAAGTPLGSPGTPGTTNHYPTDTHSHPDTFKGFVQADPTVTPPLANWPFDPCSWLVQTDIDGNFLAVWLKSGAGAGDWTQSLSTVDFDGGIPTVDGGTGSAGRTTGKQVTEGKHQHPTTPTTQLTNVYYLRADVSDVADTRGDSNSTHLLSPIRDPPATESGVDVGVNFGSNGAAVFDFHTAPNDPGLALWPSGALMAKIWARVATLIYGCTYKLYAGGTVPPAIQYCLQADETFAIAPATSGGFTSRTLVTVEPSGVEATFMFSAPSPGVTAWPDGTCTVQLMIRFVPPEGYAGSSLPIEVSIYRDPAEVIYADRADVGTVPTDGAWGWFTLPIPATAIPTGDAGDIMDVYVDIRGSADAEGGTIEVGYGDAHYGTFLTTPFAPARPSLVPLTRESSTGTTVVDYTQAPPPPLPGYVGTLTDTYQLFEFPLLAEACAGSTTDRLRYSLAAFCDHAIGSTVLEVLCGGPNASELDSLFGMPGQGGISGRIHTPDVAVTITGGTITMGNSNSATAGGTDDVIGVAVAGWDGGDVIWIRFHDACILKNGGSPGTGFAPFALVSGGLGAGGQDIGVTAGSIIGFKLRADLSAWDEVASPAIE